MKQNPLTTRPLAVACAAFLLTLFLALYHALSRALLLSLFFLFLLFFLSALLLFRLDRKRLFLPFCLRKIALTLLLTLLMTALALLLSFMTGRSRAAAGAYRDRTGRAELLVKECVTYGSVTQIQAKAETIDGVKTDLTVSLTLFQNESFLPGDRIAASLLFSLPEGDSLLDKSLYADGCDLAAVLANGSVTTLSESHNTPAALLARFRLFLQKLLRDNLDDESASLFNALLLGDKSGMDSAVKNGLAFLGISHLFAVSGLHLSILIGLIGKLLARARLPFSAACPLLTAATLFYMALTGFPPSMLRSGGMLLLFYLSYYVKRKREPVTALFAATTAIVLVSPRAILDLGLLLSFTATLGILLIASPTATYIDKLSRKKIFPRPLGSAVRAILSSVTVTLAATAGTLLILYLAAGKMFPLAPLSNLVFTPILTVLLLSLPLFFLLLPLPPLFALYRTAVSSLCRLFLSMAALGRKAAGLNFSLRYPFMPLLILFCLLLLVFFLLRRRHFLLPFLPIVLFFLLAEGGIALSDLPLRESESLFYFGNGQNDALVLSYEKKGLIVDFSASSSFAQESLGRAGSHSASVEADTLMLTACRPAYAAAFQKIVDAYSLKNLILPQGSESAETLAALAEKEGVTVVFYTPGDRIVWNGITLKTYPNRPDGQVAALEISLSHTRILYLRENAPDSFDIRFGPMKKTYDTVILGCSGSAPVSAPFFFDADTVVQYPGVNYIKSTSRSVLHFGDYSLTDSRGGEEKEDSASS